MKRALCFSMGTALVAVPMLALLPGCGGSSSGIVTPTATPTARATATTRPTATSTTRPSSTPTPTSTPVVGQNINLTFAAQTGSVPNVPLTPFQSNVLGDYYYYAPQKFSYADVTAGSREYHLATPGNLKSYTVGQTIDLSGVSLGMRFIYVNKGVTYSWRNLNTPGSGIVTVAAKDASSITINFKNMILEPNTSDDPAKGDFKVSGTIRWAITEAAM